MNSTELSTVIWDGDNTIWDWMKYAVPAYEAMCEEIAKIAGKSVDETAAAMKAFYTEKGSLEATGLVQALEAEGFFETVKNYNRFETIEAARKVFSSVRSRKLKMYPGVRDAMDEIKRLGLRQLVLTDAPKYQARARIRRTKLQDIISDIHAMPHIEVPDLPKKYGSAGRDLSVPEAFEVHEEKPDTNLEAILGMTREQIARQVAIIGDNDAKDMELARNFNCIGIHAKYGLASPDLIERIQKFAPAGVARRNMQIGEVPDAHKLEGQRGRIFIANHTLEITEIFRNMAME